MIRFIFIILSFLTLVTNAEANSKPRVTSILLSEHFINKELKTHVKPGLLRDIYLDLDPKHGQIFFRGIVQIPIEELRAINLDPNLSSYRFQVTIKPETTPEGYLILEFPLKETFFYPLNSKNPIEDRVVIPVQMLSVALASARGYFAALSGDFSGFDRKTAKLKALIRDLNKAIKAEKNQDAILALKNEREALKLQLAAVPIERKQMEAVSKEVEGMLGFTGEKELNLNEAFTARKNALILKLNLANFTPYLKNIMLGGIRIVHDKKDGPKGENYFAVDINAEMPIESSSLLDAEATDEPGLKVAPAAIIRINQSLFESDMVLGAEKKAMGSKLSNFKIELKKDGLHVTGIYHAFFLKIPFDTIVDFDNADDVDDAIDVSVRDIKVWNIDFEFMAGFILEAMKYRLDQTLKSICSFEYLGEKSDKSRVLRVHFDPKALIPALPGLHLADLEIREHEFLFKIDD